MKEKYSKKSKLELVKIVIKKDKIIEKLESDKCELAKKLLMYENAHTPPSLQKKKRILRESSGKLGASKGHEKYEREEPEVTSTEHYTVDSCPYCKSKSLIVEETRKYLEEEIPEIKRIKVTQHLIDCFLCDNCGRRFVAEGKIPKDRFGPNLRSHIVLLKHEDRLPLRKVEQTLKRNYGLSLTHTGIMKIIRQVAKRLSSQYYEIIKRVRGARVVYVDETGYKVNGKQWWLWTFVCGDCVLFVIRESRSKSVVEEILGKNFNGIIGCDGWKTYERFSERLQRCWAHLLREAFHLKENHKEFEFHYETINELFKEIKNIRERPPDIDRRKDLVKKLKDKFLSIAFKMEKEPHSTKLATTIKNGINYWFTCVENLEVEPTNNFAEQALRELIVQRKIMGGLRSEKGAETLEIISTMIATWKKQEKPLLKTMKEYVS